MKMSGQSRQRLCGVSGEEELSAGGELRAQEKSAGKITSAAYSPRMRSHIGLAMIKRGFTEPGTQLSAPIGGREISVRVTSLPFEN